MKKNSRKNVIKNIILVSSIVVFFAILLAIAIIIAQGKKVTPGGLVDTSIIRLNTIPEDVTAYIDGKKVNRIENRLEGIETGEVTLKLERNGYSSWEKTITLEPGVVKDVYAQLYPTDLQFEQITNTEVDKLFFPEDVGYLFYTVLNSEIDTENGMWKYKLTKNLLDFGTTSPSKITSFETELINKLRSGNYDISVSPDSNRFIVNLTDSKELLLFDANNDTPYIDLVVELGYYPQEFNWFKNSDSLVIKNNSVLFEYNIPSKESTLISYTPENDPVYGINTDIIYHLRPDSNEIHKYLNKVSVTLELPTKFIINEPVNQIITLRNDPDVLIVKDNSGLNYIDIDKDFFHNLSTNGEVVSVSNNGLSIMYNSGGSLYVFTLEETPSGKSYKTNTNIIELVQDDIATIYFSNNSTNIIALIVGEDDTRTLWLMDYDGQNPRKIVSEQTISGLSSQITNDGTSMYLLLEDGNESENTKAKKNVYKLSLEAK